MGNEFTISTTKGKYNILNTIGQIVKTINVKNDNEIVDVKGLKQGIYYVIGKTTKTRINVTQ